MNSGADGKEDVLDSSHIVVAVRDLEGEVEAGANRSGRVLDEPNVRDLQDILFISKTCVGETLHREGAVGDAATIEPNRAVQVDAGPCQPSCGLHDLDALDLVPAVDCADVRSAHTPKRTGKPSKDGPKAQMLMMRDQ